MSVHPPAFNVQTGSPTPVYRQISDQVRAWIGRRYLHRGDLLPTEQELAESLVVSPSIVRRAFRELVEHGVCNPDPNGRLRVTARPRTIEAAPPPSADLTSARDLQLRLMSPSLIEGSGFVAAARQGAAHVVGGDFHHLAVGTSGIVDVIVGDVAGSGVAAGLVAASVCASAPLIGRQLPLGQAMSTLNEHLAPLLGSRRFVAMSWARFDPQANTLELANAGLPDPYLLEPHRSPSTISASGTRLPLGSRMNLTFESVTVPFEVGTQLLMITDGIPEATAEDGEPLGYERFGELLSGQASRDTIEVEQWLADLLARVAQHTGNHFADDWTAVVLRAIGTRSQNSVRPDDRAQGPIPDNFDGSER